MCCLPPEITIECEKDASLQAYEVVLAVIARDKGAEGWVKFWCLDSGKIAIEGNDGHMYLVGHFEKRKESKDEPGHAAPATDE